MLERVGQDEVVRNELLDILDLAQAFVRDLDGTIRSWSTGVSRLYGWTAAEAVGRISHDLLKTEFPTPLAEIEQRLITEKFWRGELCHTTSNGRRLTVFTHWSLYRTRSNGTLEVVEVNNDISELKDAQRELVILRKENESRLKELKVAYETAKRFSAIVESSNDAIIGKSLNGLITSWNKGAERIFGYRADEAIGQSITILAAPDRPNETLDILALLRRGESVEPFDSVRRRKDGRLIDVSLTVSPIFNPEGKLEGASKTARDITEKKRAERLLLTMNEELRQFAYAAAHDLQEPIRDISLYAQMIAKECGSNMNDRSRNSVAIVLNGARRMQELIQDLRRYTSATSVDEAVVPTSSEEAIKAALDNLREDISKSEAVITLAGAYPLVLIHRVQLIMVVQHLVANAIKYRGPRTPVLTISGEKNERECHFSIQDNGIGIDREHWARIFGVFKRLHGRDIPGTGIGLALCQRIVTHYGGRIWVESDVDLGSTFHFTIPVAN